MASKIDRNNVYTDIEDLRLTQSIFLDSVDPEEIKKIQLKDKISPDRITDEILKLSSCYISEPIGYNKKW